MSNYLFTMACLLVLCGACATTGKTSAAGEQAQASLLGSEWILSTINGKGYKGGVPFAPGSPPTLRVNADSTASGFSGCNRFTGGALVNGKSIKLGPIVMTRKYCEQGSSVETAMINMLETADNFEIMDGRLIIKHGSEVMAEFMSRKQPSPTTK